jgi:5-methylcytosine-specific restriction endonuclease McrA
MGGLPYATRLRLADRYGARPGHDVSVRCPGCDRPGVVRLNPDGAVRLIGLTIDHVRPRSLGGSDRVSNLRYLCRGCNTSRGNGTTWRIKARLARLDEIPDVPLSAAATVLLERHRARRIRGHWEPTP